MATAKQKSNVTRVTKIRDAETANDVTNGKHVGEVLREAREARGMTIDMVADELMIRRFYLDALEAGSFKELPERVYATGFVRSYATYIGLDVVKTVDQFRKDAFGSRANGTYQVELNMPEPVVHSVMPGRAAMVTAALILVGIIGGVSFMMRDRNKVENTIPAPPEAASTIESVPSTIDQTIEQSFTPPGTESSAAPTAPAASVSTGFDLPITAPTATTTTPAPAAANVAPNLPSPTSAAALPETPANTATAAGSTRMTVEALETSWVEVKDGKGVILFTNILKKGQLLPIPDQKGITLTTGNAGGLRVVLDGKPLAALGQVNEVKRSVPLDINTLSKL